jgi:hypothetical protein
VTPPVAWSPEPTGIYSLRTYSPLPTMYRSRSTQRIE